MIPLALCACVAGPPADASFALVIGHNRSQDPEVAELEYADDDAARMWELLGALGATTELLAVLDKDSQRVFPSAAEAARPPTRDAVIETMDRLAAGIERARSRGEHTTLYFYFAGHGDVGDSREGYVHLVDGRWSRADLYAQVIARSPADINHVIIDACNSYFLVHRRGDAHRQALRAFLEQESLSSYPNTGVILSTASEAESHEWARYKSGIFSHQLLSGLLGAADIDGDGNVLYQELAAYVDAANLAVRDPRARLAIVVEAPRLNENTPVMQLPRVAMLEVPRTTTGHYHLEDDRGVRYLDFHKTDEQPLRLALLSRPFYYLRAAEEEARVDVRGAERIHASDLTFAPRQTKERGALDQTFRQNLYAFPFGQSFAAGHAAARAHAPIPEVTAPRAARDVGAWKWTTGAVAGAAAISAGVLAALAASKADQLDRGVGEITMAEALELQNQKDGLEIGAGISAGVAVTAAVVSVFLFLADGDESVLVTPDGGTTHVAIAF